MIHLTVKIYDDQGLRHDLPLVSSRRVFPTDSAAGAAERPTPFELEYAAGVLAALLQSMMPTPKGGNRCG